MHVLIRLLLIWCISMADKPRYYITTAIAYPNGPPHIGHAYEAIATDAIARFMRLDGYDVLFLTGTDEHGQKMQQTATREELTPRELVERNVPRFQAMVERMKCSNDDFIRTTEERHHRSSAAIWQRMEAAGDIYLDKYSGWYSVRDEAYYDESETQAQRQGRARAARRARRSNGSRRRAISSGCPPTRTSCSISTRAIPISCCRRSGSTRSRASSRAGCRTSRSRAPPSTGASRCRAIPSTSCMCGSTR